MKSQIDKKLWNQNVVFCGVDEVGRGALAGPVVAAAVILPPFTKFPKIKDSKQLTPKQREDFYSKIMNKALAVGVGSASYKKIDQINIRNASFLAMKRAICKLMRQETRGKKQDIRCEMAIVDGFPIPDCQLPTKGIIKGDEKSISIACASIIAKVTRDRLMDKLHKKYPQYNFVENKGYPTPFHKNILKQIGPSKIHRRSFSPVCQSLR